MKNEKRNEIYYTTIFTTMYFTQPPLHVYIITIFNGPIDNLKFANCVGSPLNLMNVLLTITDPNEMLYRSQSNADI